MLQKHTFQYRKSLPIIIVSAMFCLLLGLSACKPQEAELPFQSIEQKEWSGTGQSYEALEPGLVILARPTEANDLDQLVTKEAGSQIHEIDYAKYFVVAVFQGNKPSTGYSIQAERVVRQEDEIYIYARAHEPEPQKSQGALITSPYHIIEVLKSNDWNRSVTFKLVINSQPTTSIVHFVP